MSNNNEGYTIKSNGVIQDSHDSKFTSYPGLTEAERRHFLSNKREIEEMMAEEQAEEDAFYAKGCITIRKGYRN